MHEPSGQAKVGSESRTKVEWLLEELDLIILGVGVVAAVVANLLDASKGVVTSALVVVAAAGAVRLGRVKYQIERVDEADSSRVQELGSQMAAQSSDLLSAIGDLRSVVISEHAHEAMRCNRADFYKHMLRGIAKCGATVDLTQLDARAPKSFGTPEMEAYFNRQIQIVQERPHVKFRRIVAVPTMEKLSWLLDVVEQVENCINFQIAWISVSQSSRLPPPLSLQIFDDIELCLVDPTVGLMKPEEQRNMLWARGRDICQVFSVYYNSLWEKSTVIKEGGIVYWEEIEGLHRTLAAQAVGLTARKFSVEVEGRISNRSGRNH